MLWVLVLVQDKTPRDGIGQAAAVQGRTNAGAGGRERCCLRSCARKGLSTWRKQSHKWAVDDDMDGFIVRVCVGKNTSLRSSC